MTQARRGNAQDGVRLFVALDPPASVREDLGWWGREVRREIGPVRLVDVDQLHVTVCFLGARAPSDIDAIAAAVEQCARPIGRLAVGGPLWLPRRRPRLLAVALHDDDGSLRELQAELAQELMASLGWEPEDRSFLPHVTVARMPAGGVRREVALPPTPDRAFSGETLTLYRSVLHPSGATYEALAQAPLDGTR